MNLQSSIPAKPRFAHLQSVLVRRIALAALLVLAAALSLWRFDAFQLGVYGDDAEYVVLARSLVDGPAYANISRPVPAPTRFPFGWPLVLAPLVALSGGEYGMLKIASLLFTLANVALIVLGWPHLMAGLAVAGPAVADLRPSHRRSVAPRLPRAVAGLRPSHRRAVAGLQPRAVAGLRPSHRRSVAPSLDSSDDRVQRKTRNILPRALRIPWLQWATGAPPSALDPQRSDHPQPSRWKALALPVGLLYATSPLVVDHSRMVMSEPAFLFFALAGLLLTGARAATPRRRLLLSLALGVVWVMAAYTRTIGVTLVAASVAWLLLQRRYRRLLLAALSAAVFVALLVAATPLRFTDLVQGGRYVTELASEPAVYEGEDPTVGDVPAGTLPLSTRIRYGLRGYGESTVRDTLVPFVGGRTVARLLGSVGLGWLPALASAVILLAIAAGFVISLLPSAHSSILSGVQRSRRMSGWASRPGAAWHSDARSQRMSGWASRPGAAWHGDARSRRMSGWASGPGAAWHGDARSQKDVPLQPVHLYVALYAVITIVWMWSLPRLLYGILPFMIGFLLLGLAAAADGVAALLSTPGPHSSDPSVLPTEESTLPRGPHIPWLHLESILKPAGAGLRPGPASEQFPDGFLRGSTRRPTPFATAFVAFVVCVSFVANVTASLRIGDSHDHTPDLSAGTAWIRDNTPPDTVVLTTNLEGTYLYADRQAIPLVGSVDAIDPALAASGVVGHPVYILLTPDLVWHDDGSRVVSPSVAALQEALSASPHASLAHAIPEQHVYVYEWLPSGGG